MGSWGLIGGLGAATLLLIAVFNFVIVRKRHLDLAASAIGAQLQRRDELIQSIVHACAAGQLGKKIPIEDLSATRTRILQGDDEVAVERRLAAQLHSVFADAERHPDPKVAETCATLRRAFNEVEERLSASRRAFDAALRTYNGVVRRFQTSAAAALMGCGPREPREMACETYRVDGAWR